MSHTYIIKVFLCIVLCMFLCVLQYPPIPCMFLYMCLHMHTLHVFAAAQPQSPFCVHVLGCVFLPLVVHGKVLISPLAALLWLFRFHMTHIYEKYSGAPIIHKVQRFCLRVVLLLFVHVVVSCVCNAAACALILLLMLLHNLLTFLVVLRHWEPDDCQ